MGQKQTFSAPSEYVRFRGQNGRNSLRLKMSAFSQRRTRALPKEAEHCSLTTRRQKLIKIGAKDVALDPEPPEPGSPAPRRRFPNVDDDELLLRTLLPGPHVDKMLARSPTCTV